MQYAVDAKIEKGQPRLRVLDPKTGQVYMEWSLTRINEMLDQGEIEQKDFLHPERYGMNLLLKNLFLLSCIENMNSCNGTTAPQCKDSHNVLPLEKVRQTSQSNNLEWNFGIKVNPI